MTFYRLFFVLSLLFFMGCKDTSKKKKTVYRQESSGRINTITIVGDKMKWEGGLEKSVREYITPFYEGLPLDEPMFTLHFLPKEAFTGFAKNSRNIIWFAKDTLNNFEMFQDYFAQPQVVVKITGEDTEIQKFYLQENASLIRRVFEENERKEKIRRMKKALSKDKELENTFNIKLVYPSAYSTVRNEKNFIWIEKPISKGHMNLIAYTLPFQQFENIPKKVIAIRDSIGKKYIEGRLPNSYMITEKAFSPHFYKTTLGNKEAYLTKGMWEVKNDFMAGPFVNYMIADKSRNRWLVLEGFAFAPSQNKREYMFELNTILSTLKILEN